MEDYDYHVTKNFEARHLYNWAIFYSKMTNHRESEYIKSEADREEHSWEKAWIKINGKTIILKLNTPHEGGRPVFAGETLDIKFMGDNKTKEKSKRALEGLTGVTTLDEFKNSKNEEP